MNVITIAGQLGKDIEVRYTPAGKAVGTFSVADSQGKDKPTIWWRCQIWDRRAEALAPYLLKGQSVTVTGTVTEREYQDKDGTQKKAHEIRVTDVALQGGKPEQRAQEQRAPKAQPRQFEHDGMNSPKEVSRAKAASGFDDMDDDVPF